jgi:hypothetical protein
MKSHIIAIIVVVVILLIFCLSRINKNIGEEFIYGFWKADESFAATAEVKDMMMSIGRYKGGRNCHFVVVGDDDEVISQEFHMTYSRGFMPLLTPNRQIFYATITGGLEEIWETDRVIFDVDVARGVMRVYDKNKEEAFAILYKNNEISDIIM